MNRNTLILIASLLLLGGCSTFQPHQINLTSIHPAISPQHKLSDSQQIEVESQDMRSSSLIGFRISRLSDRAEVNLPLPATKALSEAAKVALVKLGATPAADNGTAKITVKLEELSYTATQKALQTVDLSVTIQINAEQFNETFSGSYTTDKQYQYATTPSLQDNEQMVNEVITLSIGRAFNDPKLISFLKN
ncbi:YajG family lipoprotein [Amphritea sp. HPY]|uniref:YajG family lipoprotein n=1 Tax=Amphritea sp. HPY TaxID=3421652 RepID=UPI003D7E1B18